MFNRKIIYVAPWLLLLFVCISSFAVSSHISYSTKLAVKQTILDYVKQHTAVPVTAIKLTDVVRDNNYVRVKVIPNDSAVDPAIVFLQYTNNQWQVLSMGTAFDAAFYQQYQIPKSLQLK